MAFVAMLVTCLVFDVVSANKECGQKDYEGCPVVCIGDVPGVVSSSGCLPNCIGVATCR